MNYYWDYHVSASKKSAWYMKWSVSANDFSACGGKEWNVSQRQSLAWLYAAQDKPMPVHWLWWEHTLTRWNSSFASQLSLVALAGRRMLLFQDETLSHCVVRHLAAVHEAHLLGGFLGMEWEIFLSEGFGLDSMNPPLLLDMRADSWCLGAGVWQKYLKILLPGPAMALLTAFSNFFFF